jgi:hypothetical protein
MDNIKRCSGCHKELPATAAYFYRNTRQRDGLHNQCKECHRQHSVAYAHAHRDLRRKSRRASIKRLRIQVIEHYSNGVPKCLCCGESHAEFLVLDHIQGGGTKQRKNMGGTAKIFRWLRAQGYPEGYRVLCFNCNASFGTWGYCPHQKETEKAG